MVLRGDRAALAAGRAPRTSGGPSSLIGSHRLPSRPCWRCTTPIRLEPGPPTSSTASSCCWRAGHSQSSRATTRDLLPRHHRLYAADPGARRRRGRGPGRHAGAAGPTELGAARRQADQVAGRRGHVPLQRPRPGRALGARDGGRARGCGASAGARGPAYGPVLFQEGDYFGQTVNVTARIADYARPGEVLVSQAVADASHESGIAFAGHRPRGAQGRGRDRHLLRAHVT